METPRPRVLTGRMVSTSDDLLPTGLALPEINFVAESDTEKEISLSFDTEYRGLTLSNDVRLIFYNHPQITKLARIKLNIAIAGRAAGYFEAVIENGRSLQSEHGVREDAAKHKYMNIYNRKVETGNRRQGIGEYGISVIEQLAGKISEKHPELAVEWIQINTQLSSMAKLIVDRSWLQEHGLSQFASPTRNLGYVPYKGDENLVRPLLEAGLAEAADTRRTNIPPLRFVKIM